jgi:hypothetical protein
LEVIDPNHQKAVFVTERVTQTVPSGDRKCGATSKTDNCKYSTNVYTFLGYVGSSMKLHILEYN